MCQKQRVVFIVTGIGLALFWAAHIPAQGSNPVHFDSPGAVKEAKSPIVTKNRGAERDSSVAGHHAREGQNADRNGAFTHSVGPRGLRIAQTRDIPSDDEPSTKARQTAIPAAVTFEDLSPSQASRRLASLRRTWQRAAVRYVRRGMEFPARYNRTYDTYKIFEMWYYSDSGPGGGALQRWLERQSIYADVIARGSRNNNMVPGSR